MARISLRGGFAAAALGFTGMTLLAFGGQEPPSPVAPLSIELRVAALEKLATTQAAEIERLQHAIAGIAAGTLKLASAGERARVAGFESAGPNPSARTALLEGIAELAASVTEATTPKTDAPAKSPKPIKKGQ